MEYQKVRLKESNKINERKYDGTPRQRATIRALFLPYGGREIFIGEEDAPHALSASSAASSLVLLYNVRTPISVGAFPELEIGVLSGESYKETGSKTLFFAYPTPMQIVSRKS